jgi:hypothetical protein
MSAENTMFLGGGGGDDDEMLRLGRSPPRCFVRVWHDKKECRRSGRPLLVVHYRLAFEGFTARVGQGPYDVVFYNTYARERVVSVGMYQGHLKLTLRPEPFLGRWASQIVAATCRAKQCVGVDVCHLPRHNVTSVTLSVAYAFHPQEPFQRMNLEWRGASLEWIENVELLVFPHNPADHNQSDNHHHHHPGNNNNNNNNSMDVVVAFKPRVFRCQGLH